MFSHLPALLLEIAQDVPPRCERRLLASHLFDLRDSSLVMAGTAVTHAYARFVSIDNVNSLLRAHQVGHMPEPTIQFGTGTRIPPPILFASSHPSPTPNMQ
jgi:hypothetical protein